MKSLNYSKQRQEILNFLCTRKDHPTADIIYKNVRTTLPNISLGTIYRNLNLLADKGIIRRVKGSNGAEHFDADTSVHQHFICKACGCMEDIYIKDELLLKAIYDDAGRDFSGTITESDFYFSGLCKECRNAAVINKKEADENSQNT